MVRSKEWGQKNFKKENAYILGRYNDYIYPYRGEISDSDKVDDVGIYKIIDTNRVIVCRPKTKKEKLLYSKSRVFSNDDVLIDLFVKYSHDLPMASLKELITSVAYNMASNQDIDIQDAVEKAYESMTSSRTEHSKSQFSFNANKAKRSPSYGDVSYDGYEDNY
jgi:hypothetical protein